MSVEPMKYTEKDVVAVKPGDSLPVGTWLMFGGTIGDYVRHVPISEQYYGDSTHYAPAPILDLPEPPKEIPFGEAMERIKDGDRIGWKLGADLGQVVYLKGDNLMVSRPLMPDTYVTNFGVLVEGTFYEIPESTETEPKTTGLKWWEAIEAVRGTDKMARHVGARLEMDDKLHARWNGCGVLVTAKGDIFSIQTVDVKAEWEIVE